MHNVSCACNNVLRLVAASLFTIFISTCTMINFKLIVSKNEINEMKSPGKPHPHQINQAATKSLRIYSSKQCSDSIWPCKSSIA